MKRLEEARRVEEERIRLAEEEARRQIEAAEAIQVKLSHMPDIL